MIKKNNLGRNQVISNRKKRKQKAVTTKKHHDIKIIIHRISLFEMWWFLKKWNSSELFLT